MVKHVYYRVIWERGLIQALNNISSQDIDKLISSMNRRFHAVLASKGYKTTY